MTTPKLFVNLAVDDLDRTLESFTSVGFSFDERSTDETPTGMVIGEDAYAMLSPEPRFTMKPISHGRTHIDAIRAISAESAVRRPVDAALAAGGSPAGESQEPRFTYARNFHDPDGATTGKWSAWIRRVPRRRLRAEPRQAEIRVRSRCWHGVARTSRAGR
jgi:predicted lactoylglutathione lyase